MDEICYTQPIADQICVCATDQMICDHSKGCLCKVGGDCGGGQRLLDLTRASPLEEQDQNSNHGATVAIVLSVLFLSGTIIILIMIYYRRRLKVSFDRKRAVVKYQSIHGQRGEGRTPP